MRADDLGADMLLCHQVIETASLREKAVSNWKMLVRCSVIELEAPVGDDGGGRPRGRCVVSRVTDMSCARIPSTLVHHCSSRGSRRSLMNTVDLMCSVLVSP